MASERRITAVTAIGVKVPHPFRQNLPFGKFAFPVLGRRMQDPEPFRRKRALETLSDLVMNSKQVATKEFSGIIPILKEVCRDEEDEVRINAARSLGSVTATASGRRVFQRHNLYEEALVLIEDENESVRKETHVFLRRLVHSPMAAEGLVEAAGIPALILRIPKEPDYILEDLLHTLHACCVIDDEQAVTVNGLEAVVPLLQDHSPRVKEKAATVLMDLTVETLGRNEVLDFSIVSLLVDLCTDEDALIKAKSLSALMMIVNAIPAKFQAIEEQVVERLLPLTNSNDVEIRLNAIKVLTAIGETPAGREILLKHYIQVTRLLNENIIEVQRAAKKLHAVIIFKP